ncbi:MAG: AarF/UbiB family protein [Pirellulales bacterium]
MQGATVNWELLIDEAALASVLPGEYGRFARPVRDGLVVFLNGLPDEHQSSVAREQAALDPTASISLRLATLARSCPVLQKLGQILARDRHLAPELRRHLSELESLTPTVSLDAIQASLAKELGPLGPRGIALDPPAIAEASVAVVIPFTWNARGHRDGPPNGVFKLLKPGIEQRLDLELGLLEKVGTHLDERCHELKIPHLDYRDAFQRVREKLACEIRLDEEQRHLTLAKDFYSGDHRIQIPTLFDEHSTPRVTAMERVTGGKITDHALNRAEDKRRLADLVAKALITLPIFSPKREAMFHADPHAGNLFLTDDHRLAILDWSLVGWLGERERVAIVQIVLGAVALDATRIASVLEGLADRQCLDRPALAEIVRRSVDRIRRGQIPGLAWLIEMLDEAVRSARLRVAADLMLFRKTLHTLEGVVAAVAADDDRIDDVLLGEFLRHFAVEWPRRWCASPASREFATRLSNLDLTQTLLNFPSSAVRFWTGCWLDLLKTGRADSGVSC